MTGLCSLSFDKVVAFGISLWGAAFKDDSESEGGRQAAL